MTPEEVGEQHAVAAVDVWSAGGKQWVRWSCACTYRVREAVEVPSDRTPHDSLRESHFRHLRRAKRRAGVL